MQIGGAGVLHVTHMLAGCLLGYVKDLAWPVAYHEMVAFLDVAGLLRGRERCLCVSSRKHRLISLLVVLHEC